MSRKSLFNFLSKENYSEEIGIADRKDVYLLWTEKGWWTSKEAICVFLGFSPDLADDIESFQNLVNDGNSRRIVKLVDAAVRDNSVKKLLIEPMFWSNRAPCKNWVQWAMNKPSIKVDPQLVEAVGVKSNTRRSKDSYRPEDEKIVKASFIAIAKTVLHICPKARLKDIKKLVKESGAVSSLPDERTLRNWLKEGKVKLYPTKQPKEEVQEIEQKLFPMNPD